MTATYAQAQAEMQAFFAAAWAAVSGDIAGYVPEVRYPGDEKSNGKPDISKHWARYSAQQVTSQQSTYRSGANQPKRYRVDGLVFIQVFSPMSEATAMPEGQQLAEAAKNVFRGKATSSNIIFINVRINELDPDRGSYRWNVVAEYYYDEIG